MYGNTREAHEGVQRRWRASDVDTLVRRWTLGLLADPKAALKRAQVALDDTAHDRAQRADARAKAQRSLEGLEQERTRIVTAYAQGRIDDAQLAEQQARITAPADQLKAVLDEPELVDTAALQALIAEVVASRPKDQAALVRALRARGMTVSDEAETTLEGAGLREHWRSLVRASVRTIWLEDDGTISIEGVLSAPALVHPSPPIPP